MAVGIMLSYCLAFVLTPAFFMVMKSLDSRDQKSVLQDGLEGCVRSAYRLTARQIASYSCVTLMGFLALAVSPFRPVVLFGLLGFSSIFLGLFGDLILVQSLILSSGAIRRSILRLIEKEAGREREEPGLHGRLFHHHQCEVTARTGGLQYEGGRSGRSRRNRRDMSLICSIAKWS